jgi:undecaprenyl diphosphate synthase
MDGNGRWAQQRYLPRIAGHREGVESVREIVRTCRELGIPVVTLYAFSRENWNRPKWEVKALMGLLARYLKTGVKELKDNGIALKAIGDLGQLPPSVLALLQQAMAQTEGNRDMVLNMALSYSGRAEIVMAVRSLIEAVLEKRLGLGEVTEKTFETFLYTRGLPDPDLLIRTSGEYRLSDFLIYQTAYTEMVVTTTLWPDFRKKHLLAAIQEYQKRERRFGMTSQQIQKKKSPKSRRRT